MRILADAMVSMCVSIHEKNLYRSNFLNHAPASYAQPAAPTPPTSMHVKYPHLVVGAVVPARVATSAPLNALTVIAPVDRLEILNSNPGRSVDTSGSVTVCVADPVKNCFFALVTESVVMRVAVGVVAKSDV